MNLREEMPSVAAFVDECRSVFGDEAVNPSIRAAMKGDPLRFVSAAGVVEYEDPAPFYASENGIEFGVQDTRKGITLGEMAIGPVEMESRGRK